MPELPDVEAYLWALRKTVVGRPVRSVRLKSIFLVRSIEPTLQELEGAILADLSRLGKRLVFEFEKDGETLWMVLHLMISGRLRWGKPGAGLPGKMGLCAFDFDDGSLIITEASKQKRASIFLLTTEAEVEAHDPGGAEIADLDAAGFATLLRSRNHTLKRALTDPRIFSGIGGAYSDEIMHRARVSPLKWTTKLDDDEVERLFEACRFVLDHWTDRIIRNAETGSGWPDVTAFQDGMAVHGRFGEPCPVCGSPVQRIVYASNETNYCPSCQTGGRLLADRSLSRLLKKDWPRSLEELEELREPRAPGARSKGRRTGHAGLRPNN